MFFPGSKQERTLWGTEVRNLSVHDGGQKIHRYHTTMCGTRSPANPPMLSTLCTANDVRLLFT
ncbi:hypothetical protein DPMN_192206 [Dreissena polymorpha]|uniref:Uncharacterized protein n=1 Tax=Dreissena polymorpha TaxID=45954 RepID=A0A9D3XZB9_DREPO|nr:hypothetical protein DPMN_192206 [Dreissena polymorpha]